MFILYVIMKFLIYKYNQIEITRIIYLFGKRLNKKSDINTYLYLKNLLYPIAIIVTL